MEEQRIMGIVTMDARRMRLRNTRTGQLTEWAPVKLGEPFPVPKGWNIDDCVFDFDPGERDAQTATIEGGKPR